ncbi:MAG: Hpt domain-containing protein [Alphaproteobacteria bacterium]
MGHDPSAVDYDVLHEAKSLMKARWPDLVNGYLSDAARYVDGIKQGINDNDCDAVSFNAHSLKSSSLGMGAKGLGDVACSIESGARGIVDSGGDISVLNDLIPLVEEALDHAVTNLKSTI